MKQIGLTASGQLVIRAAHGDCLADVEKLDWRKSAKADVSWAAPLPLALPPELDLAEVLGFVTHWANVNYLQNEFSCGTKSINFVLLKSR